VAATTHAQTVSGDDPQLTNARTPTAHQATHVTGADQIPNASATARGLLGQLSGNTTDYVGGDNTCHALPAASTVFVQDFGTIAGATQTVDVAGARDVWLSFVRAVTTGLTLTINHLPQGANIFLEVGVSASFNFKMAATDASNHTYTIQSYSLPSLQLIDLVGTGIPFSNTYPLAMLTGKAGYHGTATTPRLDFLSTA
jgi:hypothetical protein